MGWAKENLSQAERARIARSLFEVTEEAGDWLNGKCPLHDDSNPSFGYNAREDYFKCLAECVDSGDLIKLYSLIHGLDDVEGFKSFKGAYGSDAPDSGPGKPKPKRKEQPKQAEEKEVLAIPEDVWERMGQLPGGWIRRLQESRGWSPEIIKRLDLRMQTVFRTKTGDIRKVSGDPERVAIPVRDPAGQLCNVRLYKPGAKERKIISWGKDFGRARLFPPANMIQEGTVLLCEGEPDTLCALSQGFNAVTQTAKTRVWTDEHLTPFKDRDVVIAYDADQVGQRQAQTAGNNIHPVARSVRLLAWPEFMGWQDGAWPKDHGQDLTDFFVKHKKTAQDLQELIMQAVEFTPTNEADVSGVMRYFARGVSGRLSFKPRILADAILKDIPLLSDPKTGQLYRWNAKFWDDYPLDHVKKLCLDALGDEADQSRVNDSSHMARILSTIPSDREVNDCADWVPLQNGMLNLNTLELKPHAKDYYATHLLSVTFDPESTKTCDRWLRFLDETIQTPEIIAQVQEFFGYCLTRDTRFEKCLFCLGPGADGKSKLLGVLRNLVGTENTSAVSFADLEDQFHRSTLHNKLLNIATEVGSRALESPYFKAIVSGDAINASFKHNNPFEFVPYVKLAFAGNRLPKVLDNSDGLFRRLLIVKFKRQFLDDADKDILDKLLDELSEIFGWALAGLHRLREQGGFTDCSEARRSIIDYRRLNNPVLCFVEDRCSLGEGYESGKDDVYSEYRSYCAKGGYGPMNKENFFRELYAAQTNLIQTRVRVGGKRKQKIKGIKVEAEVEGT